MATQLATVGGFGRGRAPGTWGSLVGLLAGAVSLQALPMRPLLLWLGVAWIAGSFCSSVAEQQLKRHDPPAVILDEVLGMASVVILLPWTRHSLVLLALAFVLFRAFDILKPPPLKLLARLPAGWGIMADDLGAAVYTCLVLLVIQHFR